MTTALSSGSAAHLIIRYEHGPTALDGWRPPKGESFRELTFGTRGRCIIEVTTHTDITETSDAWVAIIGTPRTTAGSLLSARNLVQDKTVTLSGVRAEHLRGDVLIVYLSKTDPRGWAYKSLFGACQWFWSTGREGWVAANALPSVLAHHDRPALDPDVVPSHFLFRSVPGSRTYYQGINRLLPGCQVSWDGPRSTVQRVLSLRDVRPVAQHRRIDERAVAAFSSRAQDAVAAYLTRVTQAGGTAATLLSGGIDSSLIQLWVDASRPSESPSRSFSYRVLTPEFDFEVEYADRASALFGTNHTFVPVDGRRYGELLERSIAILGQPPCAESIPCLLPVADAIVDQAPDIGMLFSGQGADALHGLSSTWRLARARSASTLPGSRLLLDGMARVLARAAPAYAEAAREIAAVVGTLGAPYGFLHPCNGVGVYSDLRLAQRAFGDAALQQAFDSRRALGEELLETSDLVEQVHVIDLLGDAYETAWQGAEMLRAGGAETSFVYLDDEVIRATLAFHPRIRFFHEGRNKPVLRALLERRSRSDVTRRQKGSSGFRATLMAWMERGPLRDLVRAIRPPAFLSAADFRQKIEAPDWFTWNLLLLDLLERRIASGIPTRPTEPVRGR